MNQKVIDTINKYKMLNACKSVVVGLSGGADSVALTHFLLSKNITVIAAHINHSLRGEESDRDEAFVREFCLKFNIKLFVLKVDLAKIAKESFEGLEECGRRIRYEYFNKILLETSSQKIATAHNLNDSAETMLLNITRGTGINGLASIPPVRDNIIRPLLFCTRDEIEDYCKENNLDYVIDSSNLCNDYSRNKLRNLVVPVLKEMNPSFLNAVKRLSQSAIEDESFIDSLARKALTDADFDGSSFLISVIKAQNVSIINRVIRISCQKSLDIALDYEKLLSVRELILNGKTSKRVQIKGNFFAEIAYERICFKEIKEITNIFIEQEAKIGENILEDKSKIIINKYSNKKINKNETKFLLDCDKIKGVLFIRNKKEADYFKPVGKQGGKTLKRLFIDTKIPKEKREQIILLCDEEQIIWVEGFGAADNKVADENTKKCLEILLERGNE